MLGGQRLFTHLVKFKVMGSLQERYLRSQNLITATVLLVLRRLLHGGSPSSVLRLPNVQTVKMEDQNDVTMETRKLGYEMCKDSIGGVWAQVEPGQFKITTLSGGLTNYLYKCSLADEVEVPDNQPREVLFRVYGDIATSSNFVVQNSVIFAIMSEKKMGPKLFGMNTKYRLEEFVDAVTLTTPDIQNAKLSRMIARKIAQFHVLDMPLCKEPRFLFDTLDEWMAKSNAIFNKTTDGKDAQFMQIFKNMDLQRELQTLKSILKQVQSPVVFCHNDLQEGNIMYCRKTTDPDKQLTLIDWEYCSYNYRGYDLGNHFVEWCYNYNVTEFPFYSANIESYPSRQQQEEFIKAYLEETEGHVTDEAINRLYLEANTYVLASHFLWGLWGILQSEMSSIQFGFLEYAQTRLEHYFIMKERLPSIGLAKDTS